jgi:hypothetical protein
MWWAGDAVEAYLGHPRPLVCPRHLIFANADGDPAADGMRVLLTVGRCNVEHEQRKLQSAFKGVDLESESQ